MYFRNFFYRLIFYSYRKVSTVTSTTFTPIEKALRIQGFQPLVTLDDGEIRKFSIGLFFFGSIEKFLKRASSTVTLCERPPAVRPLGWIA